jgi:hypothetical protein
MNVDELLSRAWAAVQTSDVPESLQAVAFKEAVDFLRADAGTAAQQLQPDARRAAGGRGRPGQRRAAGRGAGGSNQTERSGLLVDEAAFFTRLAAESGVEERQLRDILQLADDGKVHVIPPARTFGSNLAEQARNVIALVAGARGRGLEERPVSAKAVREELQRRHCYDGDNFAVAHLGRLKGFNAGANRNEIVLSSKWTDEFTAAVAKAHGQDAEE